MLKEKQGAAEVIGKQYTCKQSNIMCSCCDSV